MALAAAQLVLQWAVPKMAPAGREKEYVRAYRLIAAGPFATRHRWTLAATALAIPLFAVPGQPVAWGLASALTLAALAIEQDTLVRAGQAPAIS
jgi:hypothetical protein